MQINHGIYASIKDKKSKNQKQFAVLIDPDKLKIKNLDQLITTANEGNVDYFFIGGSLIMNSQLDQVLATIKKESKIPMILFPGNSYQLSYKADALLFLSLISGRNPELLIGKHVVTAPFLKISPLEIISCGYMLVDGGRQTTVQYMSNTMPIPSDKDDIAISTAMAGEMLGLKLMYLDAGSGAQHSVPTSMIEGVSSVIDVPLIVGGGIKDPESMASRYKAGADLIVVGNAIEHDQGILKELVAVPRS